MFGWFKPHTQARALSAADLRAVDQLVCAEAQAPQDRATHAAPALPASVERKGGWLTLGAICALEIGGVALAAGRDQAADDDRWWERSPEPHEMWHPQWDMYWGD